MHFLIVKDDLELETIPHGPTCLISQRGVLLWLGLGHPWGWLAFIGHHWPQLTKKVIHKSIKYEFEPIASVLMIWYCVYSMWTYSECCASEHWVMIPKPLLPSLPSPFLSIAGLWSTNVIHWRLFQNLLQKKITLFLIILLIEDV